MTTLRVHLSVNVVDIQPERVLELATAADVTPVKITKPGRALGVYTLTIEDDLLGAERLRDLLRRHGVESFVRQERVATAREVATAPLLVLHVDRAEQGHGGPRHGTKLDLCNACEACGTGAMPTGDVLLKKSDVPTDGDVFRTYDGELFVSDRVRERLSAEGVTGADFHGVRAAGNEERLRWSQLLASSTLPPIDRETSGGLVREGGCTVCDRDGWFEAAKEPLELRYDLTPRELGELPDIVSTREHFGLSRLRDPFSESVFAQPLVLVKPRVVDALRPLGIGALEVVPVELTGHAA